MDAILYNTSSDRRKIDKDLSLVATTSCILKEGTDKNSPFIVLAGDYDCNYCKFDGKYFYLSEKTYETGHRVVYKANVDVLMTYADEIKNCQAICIRSNRRAENLYLNDENAYVMQNRASVQVLNFPNGFNEYGEYILVTAGGSIEDTSTGGSGDGR